MFCQMKAPVKISCYACTTTRSKKRWLMRFFFVMLYQTTVNARCLCTCKYSNDATKNKSAVTRTDYYRLTPLCVQTFDKGSIAFYESISLFLEQNVFSSEKEQGVRFALVSRTTKQLICAHSTIDRCATIIGYIFA